MKRVLLLLSCCTLWTASWGQTTKETKKYFKAAPVSIGARHTPASLVSTEETVVPRVPARRTCATVEYNQQLRQQFPTQRESDAEFEQWINQKIAEEKAKRSANPNAAPQATLIKIPIIVHVIHNGDAVGANENISAAQVQSQIDVLNEDFRKKVGTPGYNTHAAGADMEIEFIPALRDPNGVTLAEPGIRRYNGGSASYTRATIDGTIKPATSWDPTRYFNFWTVTFGGADADLLGYAQFPSSSGLSGLNANGGASNTDGVVMLYTAFGRVGNVAAPYNKGRTATHEIGHWLGLRHIWGDGGCSVDDFCADTPLAGAANYGCPTGSNTCTGLPVDMIENYMDYTDDACMNIFTNDQKSRMRAVLTNSPRRTELANSTVGNPTNAPVPSFTSNVDGGCTPLTVAFTNTSTGATSYAWSFPGGTPLTSTQANPTVVYNTAGVYDVSLTATSASGTATETKSQYIYAGSSTATGTLPVNEGFEGATFPPTSWSLYNPDADTTWRKRNSVGGFGTSTSSIFINNYAYNGVGKLDAMFTPKYNFSNVTAGQLVFDVAYARYSASDSDTLLWAYSIDCGNTFIPFYKKGGTQLSTNGGADLTSAFTPTSTQWRTETLTLPTILNGKAGVQFALINKCGYGNNLYLDNIKVTVTTAPVGTAPTAQFLASPTTLCGGGTAFFTNQTTGGATSYAWTFVGGTPLTSTQTNPIVTYNTPGTYAVSLTATNASGSNTMTKTGYIRVLGGTTVPLPVTEGFETTTFPATNWTLVNPGADTITWKRYVGVGGFGTSASCMRINNYSNSVVGRTDSLFLPYIDFTGVTNGYLDFDYAYAHYNTTDTDTLIVAYSIDCGQTYKTLFKKGGVELSTNGGVASTARFVPTATQWITSSAVSSDFENKKVRFVFINKSGYGNFLYVDNIKVVNPNANPPVAAFTSNSFGGCATTSVTFTNQSTGSPTSYAWSFPGGTPATSTAVSPTVSYSTPGIYNVSLTATNANGTNTLTRNSYIVVGSSAVTSSPITENFQGATFPSTGWAIHNPDADTTWRKIGTVGGFGNSAGATVINNAQSSVRGRLDALMLPGINLTAINTPRINFDVAYARYSAGFSDTIIVGYSTNCGATFTTLWKKGGSDLSTTGADQTVDFVPTATQWRTEAVSLASIATLTNVRLAIISKNGYGNKIYLDNIQVTSSQTAIIPTAAFTSDKRGGCPNTSVQFTDQSTNTPTTWAWTFAGGIPATSSAQNPTVTYATPGVYDVTLTVTNAAGSNGVTKVGHIIIGTTTVATMPIVEGFESSVFPPLGWTRFNPDNDTTWQRNLAVSGFGTSTACASINLEQMNVQGRLDGLFAPKVNLSTVTNPEISFDVAYARYSAQFSDSLFIYYSTDCGVTFKTFWKKGGSDLSTTGADQTASFLPTPTQWRKETVSLASLASLGVVQIALVSRNGYGNKLYLDNIRIGASTCLAPVATATPNLQSICTGNVAGIALSSTIPNTTFSWTVTTTGTVTGAAAGSGSAIAQVLSGSGTVTYNIVPVAANCTGLTVQATVTVNAKPTAQASAVNTTVCSNQDIFLNAQAVVGGTYAWTGPNGFTSTEQNPIISAATPANAGTYSLIVTANNCVSTSSTVAIVVNAKPTAQAGATNSTVCAGSAIQLNAQSVANATYAWTGPNGFTSSVQNPSIANATTAATGTYSLTVTVNGCASNPATTNVTVNAKPVAQAAAALTTVCEGAFIELSAQTVTGASYAWTGPNGFTSSAQNTVVSATLAAAGVYSLVVTANSCASSPSTVTIVVNAKPVAAAGATNTTICSGSTLQLNAQSVANATYAWTGPNGFTSDAQNPSIAGATAAAAGSYSLVVTANGCSSAPSAVSIIVNEKPTAQASVTTATICAGETVQLNAVSVANATYAWTGPNGFTSSQQNPSIAAATTAASGTYSLVVTANGCSSEASTVSVTVNEKPGAQASATNATLCENATLQLNAVSVANATYAWSGPNGFTSSEQNPTIAAVTPAAAGTYSLVVTLNSCVSEAATVNVTVNATVAEASAVNSTVCSGANIQLNATTIAGATYAWSGPNGFSSTEQNPLLASATSAMSGTYSVVVTNGTCVGTASTVVITVGSSPQAEINVSAPVCEGQSFQISATPVSGATYAWTGPNGFTSSEETITISNASQANAGVYTLTVTANGCSSNSSATATVVVSPIPVTPVITISNDTLFVTPAITGGFITWLLDGVVLNAASGNFFIPTLSGAYSVFVTNAGGCMSDTSVAVVVNSVSASLAKQLSVYPNPSAGTFYVSATEGITSGRVNMSVYDLQGKVVYETVSVSDAGRMEQTLDLGSLANGMYFLKVTDAGRSVVIRLAKTK